MSRDAVPPRRRGPMIALLGGTQMLGWASSYYLPAMLATPIAAELGLGVPTVFAAFSVALVVSAAVGPLSGRRIDRHGGRPVLLASSLVFAAALAGLGCAQGPLTLFVAWAAIGVAMGAGLYESAFATLVREWGAEARGGIAGVTLMGGFASTVGWPLSAWMDAQFGWRGACFGWALLHLAIGLPLHALLPRAGAAPAALAEDAPAKAAAAPPPAAAARGATVALLAFVFAASWSISTAMAAHLPHTLVMVGVPFAAAVAIGALVGPAQVAGRLLEFSLLRRMHPLLSARLAALAHPLGAALLLFAGPAAAPAFALLHGAGNGILTIANGTLPLHFFGPAGYGAQQGWLMMPARIAQAAAPFAFGLALDRLGALAPAARWRSRCWRSARCWRCAGAAGRAPPPERAQSSTLGGVARSQTRVHADQQRYSSAFRAFLGHRRAVLSPCMRMIQGCL